MYNRQKLFKHFRRIIIFKRILFMTTELRVLIIGDFHHKNQHGCRLMFRNNPLNCKFGTINDIDDYENIYSPSEIIDTSNYPNKKFVFGPHFSTFPDNRLLQLNSRYHNKSIYVQPSEWVVNLWKSMGTESVLPLRTFAFPVDVDRFCPLESNVRTKVFIYFKRRNPLELDALCHYLTQKGVEYVVFDYVKRYNESNYLSYMQQAKFGVILDANESQGFAIEEALSCNVPLLVWNTRYMSQEYGSRYADIPCSSIPYWDERCGEYFYDLDELDRTYETFINKLDTYRPRDYILDNLTPERCMARFAELFSAIH